MACEDIQVKIVGDIADIQKLVDSALKAASSAEASAKEATFQANLAEGYARDAQTSKPKLRTMSHDMLMSASTSSYNFLGDGIEVSHADPTGYNILVKGLKGAVSIDNVPGLKALLASMEIGKIDNVTSLIDAPKKIITLSLMSGKHVIGSDVIDISPMFHQGPTVKYAIYYGFCLSKSPTEQEIKGSKTKMVSSISGLDVSISRAESSPRYQFMWIPDFFNTVTGFKFGGQFIDEWLHTTQIINNVSGRLYISDNPTHALVVTWEVFT